MIWLWEHIDMREFKMIIWIEKKIINTIGKNVFLVFGIQMLLGIKNGPFGKDKRKQIGHITVK